MVEREDKRNVDELLDALLAVYSDAQPRPGFQTRLLANLRVSPQAESKLNVKHAIRYLWAAATAAVLSAVSLTIYFSRTAALPEAPKIKAVGIPVLPANDRAIPGNKSPRPRKPHETVQKNFEAAVAEVRQQVFPTPTPLSEQERLLLRYLAGTPKEEVAIQSRSDEPVEGPEQLVPQVQQFPAVEKYSTR